MKVYEFQVQTGDEEAMVKALRAVDSQAPIPQPLEGGNMKGPLYQIIIATETIHAFVKKLEDEKIAHVYTEPNLYELEDSLYSSHSYVEWQFCAHPTTRKAASSTSESE